MRKPRCSGPGLLEKTARYGYDLTRFPPRLLKRREFARWQDREKLPDAALCNAALEMEGGLIGAALGGVLFKKRVARPGGGKRGGYRAMVAARIGTRYVFLHGFPKNEKASVSELEMRVLRFEGRLFLELTDVDLSIALESGVLMEVCCDEQDH